MTLCIMAWALAVATKGEAQETGSKTVTPGRLLIEPSTLTSLGFEWFIQGDANRNAVVKLDYRREGESSWEPYIPPLRLGGEEAGIAEWNHVTPHLFAGSLMDLEPDTLYEVRLRMDDPDGLQGPAERIFTKETRRVPQPSNSGNVRHVYPKDWEGPREEPAYGGLLHAYYGYPRFADWILTTDPVQPGDTILVHGGLYRADFHDYRDFHGLTFDGTYSLTCDGTESQPISIVAAGDGEAIFDGNGAAVLFDLTAADHHYLRGLKIRNTDVAIRAGLMNAYGCDGMSVVDCYFEDIGIGIQGQYEGSRHFYIADNVFLGREDPSYTKSVSIIDGRRVQQVNSYYAVKVHGQGHTIAYNRVKYFFDGIDICTHAQPETDPAKQSVAIDIYNNDLFLCNDNFIEADGGTYNIRILRNRCFNSGQQALSNQPVLGGPVYWIRNVVYNCSDSSTLKFWGMYPSGIIAYHNTSTGILTRDDKPGSNVHLRNNLFLPGDDSSQTALGLYTPTSYSSLDYNGYRLRQPFAGYYAPAAGQPSDFSETAQATRYETLEAFTRATGQEQHGILVDYDIFEQVEPPRFKEFRERHRDQGNWYPVYPVEGVDFRLRPGSAAVDAGVRLPGINDEYSGRAPDLGAYELDHPIPQYGPRKEIP
jgi:hypothetical protein